MRIGACFATFAILSYTKIIDNNWYLSHLFSYFLLGIQWGRNSKDKATDFTVNLNIAMNTITAIPIDVSDSGSKTTAICVTSVETTKLNLGSDRAPYGYAWVAIGYTL